MSFLRNNWIYIIVAFAVVFLIGIGYVTYTRLNQLSTLQPTDTALQPTAAPEGPVEEVSVSFEITPAVEQTMEEFSCIELVATPLSGPTPLTVSFTGLASTNTTDNVIFNFDFGDTTTEALTTPVLSDDGIVTQLTTHTYTTDGTYDAALSVERNGDIQTSTSCTITITVGDAVAGGESEETSPEAIDQLTPTAPITPTTAPTTTPPTAIGGNNIPTPTTAQIAQATTPTPTPTRTASSTQTPVTPDPTQSVATPTSPPIAVPNVPEAGTFEITLIIAASALFLCILAFAVL